MLSTTREQFIKSAQPMLVDLDVPTIDDCGLDVQEQGADGDRYGCGTIIPITGIAETTQSAMATGKMTRKRLRAESKAAMYATILYMAQCIGEAQLERDAGDSAVRGILKEPRMPKVDPDAEYKKFGEEGTTDA